jgi:hypothetical protein
MIFLHKAVEQFQQSAYLFIQAGEFGFGQYGSGFFFNGANIVRLNDSVNAGVCQRAGFCCTKSAV